MNFFLGYQLNKGIISKQKVKLGAREKVFCL